jgi:hypothetical protein
LLKSKPVTDTAGPQFDEYGMPVPPQQYAALLPDPDIENGPFMVEYLRSWVKRIEDGGYEKRINPGGYKHVLLYLRDYIELLRAQEAPPPPPNQEPTSQEPPLNQEPAPVPQQELSEEVPVIQ